MLYVVLSARIAAAIFTEHSVKKHYNPVRIIIKCPSAITWALSLIGSPHTDAPPVRFCLRDESPTCPLQP